MQEIIKVQTKNQEKQKRRNIKSVINSMFVSSSIKKQKSRQAILGKVKD